MERALIADASAALHGDRTLRKALARGDPTAAAIFGYARDERRPIVAFAPTPAHDPAPLAAVGRPEPERAEHCQRFIDEARRARTATAASALAHAWRAHGPILPLLIGPDPLATLATRRIERPEHTYEPRRGFMRWRARADLEAGAHGRTEALERAPALIIGSDETEVRATHRGAAVALAHPQARTALDALGAPAVLDHVGRALVARLGEVGIAVARSGLERARAARWARAGATPARAQEIIGEEEVAIVDLATTREARAALERALRALGVRARAHRDGARIVALVADAGTGATAQWRDTEAALVEGGARWMLWSEHGQTLALSAGRGARPQRPDDALARHRQGALWERRSDPETLLAEALAAGATQGASTAMPRAERESATARWTTQACGTQASRALAQALAGHGGARSSAHVLVTEGLEHAQAQARTYAGGAWGLVDVAWDGYTVAAGEGGAQGACPGCAVLRLRDGPRATPARWAPRAEPAPEALARVRAVLERALAHRGRACTIAWLDHEGMPLAPPETLGAQRRCPVVDHRESGERTHERHPSEGASTGSIGWERAGRERGLTRGPWIHTHHVGRGTRSAPRGNRAGACGRSPEDARTRARFEAAERHASRWHRGQSSERRASVGAMIDARARHLDPAVLMAFSEAQWAERDAINAAGHTHLQIPVRRDERHRDTPIEWLAGTELMHDAADTVWVPREWALLAGPPSLGESEGAKIDAKLCTSDTNGNAAGHSLEEATARALCELIERDARALWWYRRTPLPALDLAASGDPWLAEARARYRAVGRTLRVLDASTNALVRTAIATSRRIEPLGDGSWDPVIGSGAGATNAQAARAAIAELVQGGPRTRDDTRSWYAQARAPERCWLRRAGPDEAPWLEGAGTQADPAHEDRDPQAHMTLERALEAVRALGVTTAVVLDLTLSAREPAVAKVAAPQLCHPWHRLGQTRLREGARERALNPIPLVM